jgi:hypothetical protein
MWETLQTIGAFVEVAVALGAAGGNIPVGIAIGTI